MLVGIVYLALGMKKVLSTSPTRSTTPRDALPWVPLVRCTAAPRSTWSRSALRRRNIGGWNVQRLVAAAVLLVAHSASACPRSTTGCDGCTQ